MLLSATTQVSAGQPTTRASIDVADNAHTILASPGSYSGAAINNDDVTIMGSDSIYPKGQEGSGLSESHSEDDYVYCVGDNSLNAAAAITIGVWKKVSYTDFLVTKRTTSAYSKQGPQLQVVGDKIYYVWYEMDGGSGWQIWTAEMNTDGTGWTATKRTNSAHHAYNPQFQVVDSKIYCVWQENDNSGYSQIWTGEMNSDGTGWAIAKRTASSYDKSNPQLQAVGGKIYYVWDEYDTTNHRHQIWTAEMNADGTGWTATKRTTSAYDKYNPQFQVVFTKIYYVWYEMDAGSIWQIWTGEMNTDGTGWAVAKRTASSYSKEWPQLQVVDSKVHYVWNEYDDYGDRQIWTAEMNTDGTGWITAKRTASAYDKYRPQHQVVDSRVRYVWYEYDGYYQIWTAEMNTDGTEWIATKRTASAYNKHSPQFQVVGSKIFFVWYEFDGSYTQIWTAETNSNIYVCGDADGSGGINILDVTRLINYLYKGGQAPNPIESGDADGSGAINILDVTRLINYLYKGGPEPVCP